jgi:hypothetical protein
MCCLAATLLVATGGDWRVDAVAESNERDELAHLPLSGQHETVLPFASAR